jgi:hypothetical protein
VSRNDVVVMGDDGRWRPIRPGDTTRCYDGPDTRELDELTYNVECAGYRLVRLGPAHDRQGRPVPGMWRWVVTERE